jgi:hypothetical protein
MAKKLEVEIGALRLTPCGAEAQGVAKVHGQEIELYICGQPHQLAPGMNWSESALICGCDEGKTREILRHPVVQARMAEAKAMLLEARKSALRGFLGRLAGMGKDEMANPTPTTGEQQQFCEVKSLEISTPDVTGASSESYVEAIGEATIECDGANLMASLYLSAEFDENGEPMTNLFISEMRPDTASDEDDEAAQAAINAHAWVQGTLAQMRRDLIAATKTSLQAELDWLESITVTDARF